MNKELENKISFWKKNVKPTELQEIESMEENELLDAFTTDISFGTGGLRGIIGMGSNRMNDYVIKKSTLGFGEYLLGLGKDSKERGVVISYDCRRCSRTFAESAASVLAKIGMKVYVFTGLRPTPELSFAVRHLHCIGGIMITASHNPPQYNGYKVYDETGCQLVPKDADLVIKRINAIENMFVIESIPYAEGVKQGLIQEIDKEVDIPYIENVKTVPVNKVDKKNLSIVYTPLHGTGSVHMVKLLEQEGYNVTPVKEQMIPDGEFTTLKSPNPEEPTAFEYALKLGKEIKADVLIATDPDADRMGIAALDRNGEYQLLTGNQTGAILLNYLANNVKHDENSYVYNTIVTSDVAGAICKKHNLTLVQTLTGFKFIGEKANEIEGTNKKFFFGYEESYGYVIKPFVRDKDSFQATLLLSEVASYYKAQGKTLVNALEDIYKEYGYYLEGAHSISLTGVEGAARIQRIMKWFQNNPLKAVSNHDIETISDYDKSVSYTNGKEETIDLPKSLVLKYTFVGGGWIALRPSGTEPKLKLYIAIKEKDEQSAKDFIASIKKEILGLIDHIE